MMYKSYEEILKYQYLVSTEKMLNFISKMNTSIDDVDSLVQQFQDQAEELGQQLAQQDEQRFANIEKIIDNLYKKQRTLTFTVCTLGSATVIGSILIGYLLVKTRSN